MGFYSMDGFRGANLAREEGKKVCCLVVDRKTQTKGAGLGLRTARESFGDTRINKTREKDKGGPVKPDKKKKKNKKKTRIKQHVTRRAAPG